jgi:3,4-dihydroxy 2-butanone 4-phosphate synthase
LVVTQQLDGLQDALASLRSGGFILLHDATSRENEVDMVAAAEFVSAEHVKVMRTEAGGLVCVALTNEVRRSLGLVRMHEIFQSAARQYPILRELDEEEAPYGGKPAFSVTVNHRRTFTGITDSDRALTICELAKLSKKALQNGDDSTQEFAAEFKAPGHVHLLLESEGSLRQRRGHTELSVFLCKLAGLTPVAVMCEMLDGTSYKALTVEDARDFARLNRIPILEAQQVVTEFLRQDTAEVQSVLAWNPTSS